MGSEIIIALVGVVCTGLSSWFTFFLTKRKYNTEVEGQQIENMKQAFDAYRTTMEETVKAQNLRIEDLRRENESLRNQLNQLQNQMLTYMVGKKLGIGEFSNNGSNQKTSKDD